MDEADFLAQRKVMREQYWGWFLAFWIGWITTGVASTPDPAGQQAAGIVAGVDSGLGGKLVFSEKTGRLEVRDEAGDLIDEIFPGTAGKAVDVAGQEYRLSFGKDDMGRRSVLVRAGPSMQKPITLDVLGRKAVLSPEASLLATIEKKDRVFYEPSICGQVYYIEGNRESGGEVSRRASIGKESAILAKPSSPSKDNIGTRDPAMEYKEDMESAGNSVKSAFLTVLGLPDKQATPKANVYRLGDGSAKTTGAPSAEAGRPSASN
jgi:hypothetical protein